MANKKLWQISMGAIAVVIWMFIGSPFSRWSPSMDEMTEWQLIDQVRILQQEKDQVIDDLNAEETLKFIEGDESMLKEINGEIEELSGRIEMLRLDSIPDYEVFRMKRSEMQDKLQEKEEEESASEVLSEAMGL